MEIFELEQILHTLAEPSYCAFSGRLLPPEAAQRLLGVRLPHLRKIARELAREDWRTFLRGCPDDYFEETMLQGMVIGCAKAEPQETLAYVQSFVPKINNWSVCDSFCAGLRVARRAPEPVWRFLQPYLADEREYFARFGLVMLLAHFADTDHAQAALQRIDRMTSRAYYAQMAAAWAVSVYYVHCPEITTAYLHSSRLDAFTYRKALQKITESNRVPQAQREAIRAGLRSSAQFHL